MNERLKQLAEQAGMTNDKYGMYFAKDYHDEDGVDLEKFAELIVRECAKFAEQYIDERCGRDYCVGVGVKKHFGVEE